MKLKAMGIALAAVAVLGGYLAIQHDRPGDAEPAAQAVQAQTPAPFQSEPSVIAGHTPGDDVRRYIENVGTAGAAFDAWQLIDACNHAERYQQADAPQKCAGMTPEMRARAGELLSAALMHGVPGAAARFAHALLSAPGDALAQRRRENPDFDKAVNTVIEKLHEAAPRDREAISTLASLYRVTNAVTGQRDAEKALTYATAYYELTPAASTRAYAIAELSKGLTPEQVERARAAGLKLARECDCRG